MKIKIFVAHHEVTLLSLYPLMVRAFDPSVDEQSLIFQYNFANNTFTDKQLEASGILKENRLKDS